MKKVAILTDFYDLDRSYSLCLVAEDQVRMLLRHGYPPVFIACEGFEAKGAVALEGVELRHIPNFTRSNRVELDDNWETDIEKLTNSLREVLDGIQVVFTHDLIYQPAALKLNLAARTIANERPDLSWLHWVHSATAPSFLADGRDFLENVRKPFPNSFVVYPNDYEIPRVARNFGYHESQIKCVHHPIDTCEFWGFQELTRRMVDEWNLLDADAIGLYPIRLDRGKQAEFCIRVFAHLKRIGFSVRMIVMDFHSTGGDKIKYRQDLKRLAIDQKLNQQEFVFTSEFDPRLRLSCPREVVRDLMLLCNVYIHPSISETYSLTTQEAALSGALLILNQDFPPMRSIYGKNALYYQFSGAIHFSGREDGDIKTTYKDLDGYCYDIAQRVAYELRNNLVLAQQIERRKFFNPDYIFKRELEPLMYAMEG